MDNRTIEEIKKNETKLINEIKKLEQQNQKYKEVIDKAIGYIKQHWVIDNPVGFKNDLLEILEKEVE